MSALVAAPRAGGLVHDVDGLLAWVVRATPEEVAWNADQFPKVRDWLKASQAARGLRIKAVRLELIALRRVGQAGLWKKIPTPQQKPSRWLADMSDEDFNALLQDISERDTPISLSRRADADTSRLHEHLRGLSVLDGEAVDAGFEQHCRPNGLNEAVKLVLREVTNEGEPFTVANAAGRLVEILRDDYYVELPDDITGEPFREVVRTAIRESAMRSEPLANATGQRVRVPEYVTYEAVDGWTRVPWRRASIAQLRKMTELRQAQVAQVVERFEQQARLLEALESLSGEESDMCDRLLEMAQARGLLA